MKSYCLELKHPILPHANHEAANARGLTGSGRFTPRSREATLQCGWIRWPQLDRQVESVRALWSPSATRTCVSVRRRESLQHLSGKVQRTRILQLRARTPPLRWRAAVAYCEHAGGAQQGHGWFDIPNPRVVSKVFTSKSSSTPCSLADEFPRLKDHYV